MNIISDLLGSYSTTEEHNGADTVDRLCDRVATSTLLEDRRDAVRGLRSLAHQFHVEVGTQGMDVIMQVLQNDRSDVEIVKYALETLTFIFATKETPDGSPPDDNDLGVGFTEIFVKRPDYVSLLLSLLEEYDNYVRFYTVQVLTILLTNRPQKLQECILADPRGVSRLMDLLDGSTVELVRNEALLLLIQLTKSNPNVQKIIVFENAFDRLLDIVYEEGLSDGGIIVQDCLHLIHNLLRKNVSNQNYFRETSSLKRLNAFIADQPPVPQIAIPGEDGLPKPEEKGPAKWKPQKITNMLMMLELVRILVAPSNPNANANQLAMNKQGTLETILRLTLQDNKLPDKVRVQLRCAAAEAIRGCGQNQQVFAGLTGMDGARPRPALVTLVIDLLAFRNPFDYRSASLYCLECFLHQNQEGQAFVTSTLNQPPNANLQHATDTPLAAGAQLLAALADTTDGVSHWFACLAVCYAITGNHKAKDMLLAYKVKNAQGTADVPLLSRLTGAFSCDGMQQARVWTAEFCLLTTLCYGHPAAINAYLQDANSMGFLIQQCQNPVTSGPGHLIPGLAALLLGLCMQHNDNTVPNMDRKSLLHVIHHVIGIDKYTDNINSLVRSDAFVRAQESHLVEATKPDDAWLDFDFTVLAKRAREEIMATITLPPGEALSLPSMIMHGANGRASPMNDAVRLEGKMREKDEQIRSLTAQLQALKTQGPSGITAAPAAAAAADPMLAQEVERLRVENHQLKQQMGELQGAHDTLQKEMEDLLIYLAEQDTNRKELKARLRALGQEVSDDEDDEE